MYLPSRLSTLDPTLNKTQLNELWKAVDPTNIGSIEVQSIHQSLSDRYGKDKSVMKAAGIIEKVIQKIIERTGGGGFKGLQK